MLQWPTNATDDTTLNQTLSVKNFPQSWTAGGSCGGLGSWPFFRFHVEVGGVQYPGIFDSTSGLMLFPGAVNQNVIMTQRATEFKIYASDGFSTTWNYLAKVCLSSGVHWKQP